MFCNSYYRESVIRQSTRGNWTKVDKYVEEFTDVLIHPKNSIDPLIHATYEVDHLVTSLYF